MSLAPGTRLGPYDLQSRLGEGGMGEVWKAYDPKLQRTVAIKVLNDQIKDAASRTLAEARAASALSHNHICTIYDVGEADGQRFIVMAHVEGKPLSELIPSDGLPPESVIRYGTQIADALAHAHEHGIVHRDLKSANVVITPEAQVKLIDFGIAVPLPVMDAEAITRTMESPVSSAPMGTLAYMAPEVLRGEAATVGSDIWALGVLLYEMASGRLPFDGASVADVTAAILKESPASLRVEVPAGLRAIAQRALAKECGRRYVTGGEVRAALEALASSGDVHATLASSVSTSSAAPSIAVLPFANMSSDPEQEYFCDGIAEEITSALVKVDRLRVAGRTSAFSFKGKTGDLRAIGRTLDVGVVLEGSVRRAGNRLRITAELVNVSDGYHLWSERYDRELEGIFEIQDEIALAVVDALKVTLLGEEKAAVLNHSTENPEAYQLCLKARHAWYRWTNEGLQTAMQLFEQVLELDENYALAHFGVADCLCVLGTIGGERPPDVRRMRSHLETALRLEPGLAEAHALLGAIVDGLYGWNWESAVSRCQKAVTLNPRSAHVAFLHAFPLAFTGRYEEMLLANRRAIELDPLNPFFSGGLVQGYLATRDWDGAIRHTYATLDLAPDSWYALCFGGQACVASERLDEAIDMFERGVTSSEGAAYMIGLLGHALARAGRGDEARQQFDVLRDRATRQYVPPLAMALIQAGLDQPDEAFSSLSRAVDVHEAWLSLFVAISPTMDELRPDPRFADLRRSVGL